MRICYALPGKDRLTEFSSKPESGHVLIIYKRNVKAQEIDSPKQFTNSIGIKFHRNPIRLGCLPLAVMDTEGPATIHF